MLDTNAVRALVERSSPQLDQCFAEDRCSLSAVVVAELRFGLAKRRLSQERQRLVEELLKAIPIQPFDQVAAQSYGELRAELMRNGITLSAMDLLIASHAIALNQILLTADRAFTQVSALASRHWNNPTS
jgi:tRNA(fMet)-specific endonuclease VapC